MPIGHTAKVAVDSGSSKYLNAVRMFQEWQTGSEGTYRCLRVQMDKYRHTGMHSIAGDL